MITSNGLTKLGFVSQVDFFLEDAGQGVYIAQWKSDQPQPTEAEIETAHAEWQAEHDATQYQRDRAAAYAPLGDQMDMMYWDSVSTPRTRTWYDHIEEVKARFPK
jgi:hypothetical protein